MNVQEKTRNKIGHFVFGFIVFSIIYRFLSTSLIHQMEQPVFVYPHVDLTYWIFHFLKIPEIITGSKMLSAGFDILLLTFAIIAGIKPNLRWACFLTWITYFIYTIIYNTFTLHHSHPMAGVIIITIPFLFKRLKDFNLLWEGVRYYALWVYASAFIWKLFRGTFFHWEHGEAVFKSIHTTYLVNNPDAYLASTIEWFIIHPNLAHSFLIAGFLLQGSFLIGFFTRKLDWLWFVLPFIFHFTTYFFIEVVFIELLILNLAFVPWEKYNKVV